jgi:hypothetical protein
MNKKWRIEDAPSGERSNYNACSTAIASTAKTSSL